MYTPGTPKPHLLVPKLTRPIWKKGAVLEDLVINGPPESPLQLSFPEKNCNNAFENKL